MLAGKGHKTQDVYKMFISQDLRGYQELIIRLLESYWRLIIRLLETYYKVLKVPIYHGKKTL